MENLRGKVALITGGVSGLGLGIARTLFKAGMKVIVTYMQEEHREQAMTHFCERRHDAQPFRLDVTDRSRVKSAADEVSRVFGPIHVLCNNAGVLTVGPTDEATEADWDWVLGVNLLGTVNMLMAFLPQMKAHGQGGHIVNVSSMSAFLCGPETGVYSTSKYALCGLSESLRYSLAAYDIGVSVFCPGFVRSNIFASGRNRPTELSNTNSGLADATWLKWQELQGLGMDPVEAGGHVLRGILRNDRYVFSHTEFKEELRQHFDAILDAFPDDIPPPYRVQMVKRRREYLEGKR